MRPCVLVSGLVVSLSGCTHSQFQQALPPSYNDMQHVVNQAIEVGNQHFGALSKQHEEMSPAVAEQIRAVKDETDKVVADIRRKLEDREGDLTRLLREKVDPLAEKYFGFSIIVKDVQEDIAANETKLATIDNDLNEQSQTTSVIRERVNVVESNLAKIDAVVNSMSDGLRARLDKLSPDQIQLITQTVARGEIQKGLDAVGLSAKDIAELRQAAQQAGISIEELLIGLFGTGGAALVGARVLGSGRKVEEVKKDLSEMKTKIAKT